MNNIILNVNISEIAWAEQNPDIEEISQKIFKFVMANVDPVWLKNKDLAANLQLSNDNEVKQLNSEFRNIDKATNILSFANIDDEEFDSYLKRNTAIELGDMIIALEMMQTQSLEQDISFYDHYCHILIHGILHLLGYDHIETKDAVEMEDLEIELLKKLNIDNPYEERE
jgi:probable rRNA maturation factor